MPGENDTAAEDRRKLALEKAVQILHKSCASEDRAKYIVAAAKKFEKYLKGEEDAA